jgi:hypothetical protein
LHARGFGQNYIRRGLNMTGLHCAINPNAGIAAQISIQGCSGPNDHFDGIWFWSLDPIKQRLPPVGCLAQAATHGSSRQLAAYTVHRSS